MIEPVRYWLFAAVASLLFIAPEALQAYAVRELMREPEPACEPALVEVTCSCVSDVGKEATPEALPPPSGARVGKYWWDE